MSAGALLRSLRDAWATGATLAVALLVVETILAYVFPTYFRDFSAALLQLEIFQTEGGQLAIGLNVEVQAIELVDPLPPVRRHDQPAPVRRPPRVNVESLRGGDLARLAIRTAVRTEG